MSEGGIWDTPSGRGRPGGGDGGRSSGARDVARAAPGLARIAALAWVRTAGWTVSTSWQTAGRLVQAARDGQAPTEVLQTVGGDVRRFVRTLLEVPEPGEDRKRGPAPEDAPKVRVNGNDPDGVADLRARGEELLRRSADVTWDDEAHPAYAQILSQLAPDEGRILRMLALEGPQPAIDVRTGGALGVGVVGTELVAPGLTMIAPESGCRHPDHIQAYLNNLERLGLIWFSREPLSDTTRYQVLEAQPDALEAMKKAGRASRTVRRSIQLTPFGEDFCETCLPLHTGEIDRLPGGEDLGEPKTDEEYEREDRDRGPLGS
jgi:hypothetical protein